MKNIFALSTLLMSGQLFAAGYMIPLAQSTCQKEYLELFSKDTITMTVAFGYDDVGSNRTNDIKSLNLFVKNLTSTCSKWDQRMCGFRVKSTNPTVMTRSFFGPDGRPRIMKVITDNASISADDAANRINPLQKVRTHNLQNLFKDGLENSEITIYQGHSRDGGGPSFGPPKLTTEGHVDYDYYHKHKTDKNFMVKALAKSPNKSRIVALISCSSIRWFSKSIESQAPAAGIIGTSDSFNTSNFAESLPLMESILSYECLDQIKINDSAKASQIMAKKEFKVSAKTKKMTKGVLDQKTLENLVGYLKSPDIEVRRTAYNEIKSYDQKLLTPKMQQAVRDYTFGNVVKKNF